MTEPLDATIHLAFAFDIGYEIDLERARPMLHGEPGRLPRRRRTPESIRYRPPRSGCRSTPAGSDAARRSRPRSGRRAAELTVFDFGGDLAGRSSSPCG